MTNPNLLKKPQRKTVKELSPRIEEFFTFYDLVNWNLIQNHVPKYYKQSSREEIKSLINSEPNDSQEVKILRKTLEIKLEDMFIVLKGYVQDLYEEVKDGEINNLCVRNSDTRDWKKVKEIQGGN